ncbi:hypothetical protein CAI21_10000 [Alkalilimnicola ehrlichii]|uniref:Isochorismatase-like domain-containing protein n=1 Tax=Alkalilimnicola ehrlichii TaxID=351052 RepID=A0A3E0WVQ4_9GAMM|nr:isochorismatase family cysteine hydrolase [Alkalilimnicola ehrlichii]RFA29385.1 hypothetical protein CAI21_10000 [Alkalilimnicola ehrlichii]RFA36898.1 hypothetical protein CAL65_10330 [Alkalilimnicola ehrlichii]
MAKNDQQSFPDIAANAVLLVDVINDLEFEGGKAILEHALPMAERLAALKAKAREAAVPIIYLNDNFGQWRSDFRAVVEQNVNGDVRGQPIAQRLQPESEDYFVLKPKHSGFFGTTLETLLRFLQTRRLVIGGLTTDMCVHFTAMDAYLRDYKVHIPCDGSAASSPAIHEQAIRYMARQLKADTAPVSDVDFP